MKLILGVLLIGGSLKAGAQEAADTRRERNLHQIYEKYNSQPTPDAIWKQALSKTTEQIYTIQEGDTLWDISDTFFGDSDFWPKVWSLNKDGIFNPHEINPNEKIQFMPGTMGEAPSFALKGHDQGGEPSAQKSSQKSNGKSDEKEKEEPPSGIIKPKRQEMVDVDLNKLHIPPPTNHYQRHPSGIPASLPGWAYKEDNAVKYNVQINPIERAAVAQGEIEVHHYVSDGPVTPLGEIVEADDGSNIGHDTYTVTVKLKGANPGQKYLVVEDLGQISDLAKENEASLIQIDGEVEIQEVVSSDSDEKLYRAVVKNAKFPVGVGLPLVQGEIQRIRIDDGGGSGEAKAHVVGGALSNARQMFGPGEILILDAGSKSGVNAGQMLSIFRIDATRNPSTKSVLNPRRIGAVRVIKTSDKFATAVVVSTNEEIYVGDSTTRNPQVK